MNKANISYTRNHLSAMLARVRDGESILIVDRQHPVARLEPVTGPSACGDAPWQAEDMARLLAQDSAMVTWWRTPVECLSALMHLFREVRYSWPQP